MLATGEPKLLATGSRDEQAWSVGLPCGGEIDVFVEQLPSDRAASGSPRSRSGRAGVALHRRRGRGRGREAARARGRRDRRRRPRPEPPSTSPSCSARAATRTSSSRRRSVFAEVLRAAAAPASSTAPSTRPRRSAGPRSCSAGRRSSPTRAASSRRAERLPSADELIVAGRGGASRRSRPTTQTAIVVLTHDDKFDVPALQAALATRGVLRRRDRLAAHDRSGGAAGCSRRASPRSTRAHRRPCGLDIGADTNEETAVSILAEALASRAGRGGGPLRESKQRIHAGST